jgi:hypothetical protein
MPERTEIERETWPHESCFDCRLRMPSDGHAEAHYLLTGHQMGWPFVVSEMDWPVATEKQVMAHA